MPPRLLKAPGRSVAASGSTPGPVFDEARDRTLILHHMDMQQRRASRRRRHSLPWHMRLGSARTAHCLRGPGASFVIRFWGSSSARSPCALPCSVLRRPRGGTWGSHGSSQGKWGPREMKDLPRGWPRPAHCRAGRVQARARVRVVRF